MIAWAPFVNPLPVEAGQWALWLMLPLLVAVAVTYKTVRTTDLRRLWLEILLLLAYMAAGLVALGALIWAILAVFL